jgi:RNA polymerase sigma-70 factor (ECF subfamily)
LKESGRSRTFVSVEASNDRGEEREVVALLERGEREAAFTRIFRAHWAKVVALGFRLTHDPMEATDVAQETFLLVHRGLGSYRGQGPIVSWLMKIALHVAFKERKRRKRSRTVHPAALESVPARPTPEGSPDERLGLALASLPEEQRAVLSLFAVEGLKHSEIAEALGIPEGTVWSRLHHARRKLHELLGGKP